MPPGRPASRLFPVFYAILAVLAACSRGEDRAADTVAVYAAASLTNAFAEIASSFETEHDGVAVNLNLAGSQQLAQQLAQGAPADVFASASEAAMTTAVEAGRVAAGASRPFAGNRLVIIAPAANEAGLESAGDLALPGVRLVLADATVPAGQYARAFLATASTPAAFDDDYEKKVLANVVSYEQNVRAVLTKVALGEADAGIVYESDAAGSEVARIPIPAGLNVAATYVIAPVAGGAAPELAGSFICFVLSREGQAILARHGFLPAEPAAP
jgi:molybdate transport system substrate-binding protein